MTTSIFGVPPLSPDEVQALQERLGVMTELPTTTYQCHYSGDYFERDDLMLIPRTNSSYDVRLTNSVAGCDSETENRSVINGTSVWIAELYEMEFSYCEDCADFTVNDDLELINGDRSVCSDCFHEYSWCDSHDLYYRYDDCADCEHDRECRSRLIHDYSYRPEVQFFTVSPAGRALTLASEPRRVSVTGFELEMEAVDCDVDEGAELAQQLYGDTCYLKHDGSLSDGFEMVSHPMTRKYLESEFDYENLRELAKIGMRSAQTTSCGLHVHINSGFFADRASSLWRFMSLFYQNAEQWGRIAGRTNNSYAKWDSTETSRLLNYTKGVGKRGRDYVHYNADRYVALNLQNRNTIELRFFKGTLRPSTLKARLEAVHAVADYSVATRNNINIKASTDWDKFREFTRDNGYLAFDEYATTKGV